MKARSRNHCYHGKALRITYSECVAVALVIQHANRMRLIILSSVACPALQYFSTLSHKRYDFRGKKYWTRNMLRISLQFPSETLFLLRRIHRDTITNGTVQTVSWKVRLILLRFQSNFNFLDRFSKNIQIPNFVKIRPVVPCGWTDRHDEANIRFSQFCERV
jgi:hypothetical protein